MLDDAQQAEVRGLFDRAYELSRDARAAFLEEQLGAGVHPAVVAKVRELLEFAASEPGAVKGPTPVPVAQRRAAERLADSAPITAIGPYRIVSILGEGGMGAVYEAVQAKPQRTVALKVIRPGLASRQMLARFEHEAEVLGRLQHPGIAQIFEAGTFDSPQGPRPFFAMELVKGVPITQYADEHSLGTGERLELIARVCEAVNHAHQKGVVHRDLKPANILVDQGDQPKVLDFGVARLTESDIQTTTLRTDIGQLVGTVPYMSPEQAAGDAADVDTRSDVYALGVVAYELLAGRLPHALDRKLVHEAVRMIREEDPTPLSSINRLFRGDVETIVAKALEKDKARRYQTALELASDIRRYLRDEPIAARPAGTWYQVVKFSRRNKGLVGGVIVAFLGLILGLGGTAWKAREAERERDNAQKVSEFQADMLAQLDPTVAGIRLSANIRAQFDQALVKEGVTETERAAQAGAFSEMWRRVNATDAARDLIDATILKPAVSAVDKRFKDQPLMDAQLRQVLADRYRDLGLFGAATELQTRALEIRRRVLGNMDPATLFSVGAMGMLLMAEGNISEAMPYYQEALEGRRRVLGDDHRATLGSLNNMAYLLGQAGRFQESERIYRDVLDMLLRAAGPEDSVTLTCINNLGQLLIEQGRLDEAEPFIREALEGRRRTLGEDDPGSLSSLSSLAGLLDRQGHSVEAESLYRECLERRRRALGDTHPDTLTSLSNLGFILAAQNRLAAAEPLYREVLLARKQFLGEWHPDTLSSLNNLGLLLWQQSKITEVEPFWREALLKRRLVLGAEHPDTLGSTSSLCTLLRTQGKFTEAESLLLPAAAAAERTLPPRHDVRQTVTIAVGKLYDAWDKAEPGKGYDAKAAEWKAKVNALSPPQPTSAAESK